MRFMIALTPILLTVSGCATGSPEPIEAVKPISVGFCATYVPVYTTAQDTEQTKRQVDKNNAVWVELCEGDSAPAGR